MICVPISAATTDAAIAGMQRAAALADLVELRIDGIPDADMERLLGARPVPVIVTNRSRQEGGAFTGTEEERVGRLIEAAHLGADYLDIESATDPALKARLRETLAGRPGQLIVSWHDFSGTPSRSMLKAKMEACMADGPTIVKIVTRADDAADCLRVLELIPSARQRNQAIIAFCMGRHGRISRIAAPLLGSLIAYASLEPDAASAPGQLTVHQMREIRRLLEVS
ncbi:MAG: type I 3-dehydroquinate dehydratase [Thermodesulfobacteriota bacterium]